MKKTKRPGGGRPGMGRRYADQVLSEPVVVEFNSRSVRRRKRFSDERLAADFYKRKNEAGADPRIVPMRKGKVEREIVEPSRVVPVTGEVILKRGKRGGWRRSTGPKRGVIRVKDVGWTRKKVAVYRALLGLGAVSADHAVSSTKLLERVRELGETMPPKSLRHYLYHGVPAGYVGIVQIEGWTGYGYHLTDKGAALDLDEILRTVKR